MAGRRLGCCRLQREQLDANPLLAALLDVELRCEGLETALGDMERMPTFGQFDFDGLAVAWCVSADLPLIHQDFSLRLIDVYHQ